MAVLFNGTTSKIQNDSADLNIIGTNQVTILIWAYAFGQGEGTAGRILNIPAAASSSQGIALLHMNAADTLRFIAQWLVSDGDWQFPAPDNQWNRISITYDRGSIGNNPVIRVNGSPVSATEASSPGGTLAAIPAGFCIGNVSDGSRTWDGRLWRLRFYTEILSDAECDGEFVTPGSSGKTPRLAIGMDTAADLNDTSGNGFNGTGTALADAANPDATPPELSSATVAVDGDSLTLVFDEAVTGNTGITLAASGGAVTATYSSGDTTDTLVYSLSRTVLLGETLTLDYTPGNITDIATNALEAINDFSVTNNSTEVGGDTTPPEVTAATITGAGTGLTVQLSEAVTGNAGFTLSASGGAVTATYASGEGTSVLVYTLSRTVADSETVTLDYTPGDIEDLSANALEAFAGEPVTNDPAPTGPPRGSMMLMGVGG